MMRSTLPMKSPGGVLQLDPETGALRSRHYQVAVLTGSDAGRTASLDTPLVVGSQPDSGLSLSDPTVSRQHVELHPLPEGVRVRDLGSRNGTFSGGMRIQEAILQVSPEARLRVGQTELCIRMEEEELGRPEGPNTFGKALGQSPAMRRVFGILERVAPTEATVVLLGETGTGKEVLAHAIHAASRRGAQPFVVVDCSAISPQLIESELFGHVKGAFTGAISQRDGAFLQANGGTLFLDELGELPLEMQPKLLRALENGTVKRVGEDQPRRTQVRVIAATNRDLQEEVRAGRFRRDLYFRLAVMTVRLPPLRERPDDVPLLIRHFLHELGAPHFPLSEPLLQQLRSYDWPGNVRELRNVIGRMLAGGDVELSASSPESDSVSAGGAGLRHLPFKEAKERVFEAFTREYLVALFQECNGNVSQMARTAGINRNHVQRLLDRYGLRGERG
jgi:two-component system, NtrC family, response regulator GlrR